MDNGIEYNGISSIELGLKINRVNPFAAPTRRVTQYTVPGRNGVVIVDDGCYENVQLDYTAALYHADIGDAAAAAAIKRWLCVDGKYHRLEDSRWPDHYMMGVALPPVITQIGSVRRSIEAAISFNCRPERWLKSGENATELKCTTTISDSAKLFNPTNHTAHPIIDVPAAASVISIRVRQSSWFGYAEYIVVQRDDPIRIDTETGNAVYTGGSATGLSANALVTYYLNGSDDFELRPGESEITLSVPVAGYAGAAQICPRWWEV